MMTSPSSSPGYDSAAMIRALLIDDEQVARERLRQLLSAYDDVEIVGEADDGESAITRIDETKPDLVFLDIQMPGCTGLEVAASLQAPRPAIIFCTAYDEYAVDAFELHAVDYLLKPVNRARLANSIKRVRAVAGDAANADRAIDSAGKSAGAYPSRFLGKRSTRFFVVSADDVLAFESDGGQTKLRTEEHHYWMQPTLSDLEHRLDPNAYLRVSRAAIVRLDRVREVLPLTGGYGEVRLSDGTTVEVSRRRFKELMQRLE